MAKNRANDEAEAPEYDGHEANDVGKVIPVRPYIRMSEEDLATLHDDSVLDDLDARNVLLESSDSPSTQHTVDFSLPEVRSGGVNVIKLLPPPNTPINYQPVRMPEPTPSDDRGNERMPVETEEVTFDEASVPPTPTAFGSANTTIVANKTELPFSAIGKVLVSYRASDGSTIGSSGSGWVVGMRTVFTAAHVIEPKTWDFQGREYDLHSIKFQPQHIRPGFAWNGIRLFLHDQFIKRNANDDWITKIVLAETKDDLGNTVKRPLRVFDSTNYFDLGAFVVDRPDAPLQKATGAIKGHELTQFPLLGTGVGYPADPPTQFGFNGETMWQSTGAISKSGTNQLQRINDLTKGGSGGPWVAHIPGFGWRAVGLNSTAMSGTYNPQFSPKFGSDNFLNVLNQVVKFQAFINQGRNPGDSDYEQLY